jgi:hypothetical protein
LLSEQRIGLLRIIFVKVLGHGVGDQVFMLCAARPRKGE